MAIEVPASTEDGDSVAQETTSGSVRAIEVPLNSNLPAITAFAAAAIDEPVGQQLLATCKQALELVDQAESSVEAPLTSAELKEYAEHLIPLMRDARAQLLALDNQLLNDQALGAAHGIAGASGAWRSEISGVISRVEKGMVILDQEAGSLYNIENELRGELVPQGTIEPRMVYMDWGTPTVEPEDPPYELEVEGEIAYRSGKSTYAENENLEFELSETFTTRSDKEYEFYQSYQIDKSYVESTELTLGAKQEFPDLLWNGDLDLEEEFVQYKDKDEPLNDRQEGTFKLGFDPEWNDGQWEADFDYKYDIKVYETFSERSYVYHSGKVEVGHEFSDRLSTEGWARLDDYNYSIGSTRGNNRASVGNSWDWQPRDNLRVSASTEREVKNYDVRKERSYEKLSYESGVRWQPDDRSNIEVKGELTDYIADWDPSDSYDETRVDLNLSRDLTDEVDVSARFSERSKEYDIDPSDDLDTSSMDFGVNYNPSRRWNFRVDWNMSQYDYALAARAYEASGTSAGVSFSEGDVRVSADWRNSENKYDSDPDRDYSRDDYNFDLDYSLGEHRMRVYYGVGLLDQADPASVNDYTETRMGAEWQFAIDPDVDLRVSYDFSERSYDAQDDIEDSSFNARLTFDL